MDANEPKYVQSDTRIRDGLKPLFEIAKAQLVAAGVTDQFQLIVNAAAVVGQDIGVWVQDQGDQAQADEAIPAFLGQMIAAALIPAFCCPAHTLESVGNIAQIAVNITYEAMESGGAPPDDAIGACVGNA